MTGRVRVVVVAACMLLGVLPARADEPADCDWPKYGRDLGHSFAAAPGCSAIGIANVATLRPKWFYPTPDSVTASPSVVDGVVYVGDWTGMFYAFAADPPPGPVEPLWTFQIDDPSDVAFGRIVSSAAVADVAGRRLVVFGGGATLYVLDAASGDEVTRACVDPRADPAVRCAGGDHEIEIESSPAIVAVDGETRVLVGMDVHNDAGVGRTGVIAFRLDPDPWSLVPLWKFDPEGDLATQTALTYTTDPAHGDDERFVVTADPLTYGAGTGQGCGGVWASPAVDADAGLVFFGTASCPRDGVTSGERMWAVELRSGGFVWSYSPREERGGSTRLDDDFGASPNLLPGGLVGNGNKDGWYYARNRATGARAWSTHAGQAGHVSTDFAVGGIIGTPALGVVAGRPAIFATTALSTPIGTPLDSFDQDTIDRSPLEEGDPGRLFSLHAIDAATGEILWRSPLSRQSYGAPTVADGVLFVPSTFDLSMKAFHADTGALVWESPLVGAPSSAAAIVGDSIYFGSGTRTTDAEFKAFGGDPLEPALGAHALSRLSGVWAFEASI